MAITILYASETGNAESLANAASAMLGARGLKTAVSRMDKFPVADLQSVKCLLVITSTHGEGEPPDNGRSMWEAIQDPGLDLSKLYYTVCGLGDRDYEDFCQCGKDFDRFLEQRGAKRFHARQDCDAEFEDDYTDWLAGVLAVLKQAAA